ncbi:MAG TPA: hypothetical protein VFB78_20055 [Acidimicrobiales bacterium]|nr:hypothetical protein [Acidimicrobiales bacterium]
MITPGDEYPLHQTSRPVRHAGSDRNLYDRFFFNGYAKDGSAFFALAHGQYPGRDVADAAFSIIVDGVQHNVRASRRMGADRLDTSVGPIAVTIIEPLRVLRIDIDDRESAVAASLMFTARGPVFEEPHYLWSTGDRTVFDITRLTQNGTWRGWARAGGHEVAMSDTDWWGTRDRSWGIRPIGERETGAPVMPMGFYWLWAPLNFDDASYLFDINEHPDGSRWHESAMRVSTGQPDAAVEQGSAAYTLSLRSGTRHAESAELIFTFADGAQRITLTPLYNFYMQGIGYTHPSWGHAMYVGDDVRTYDSIVTADENEASPLNLHVQTLCRAERDDGATGTGILEQLIVGPSATLGLTDLFDMAP